MCYVICVMKVDEYRNNIQYVYNMGILTVMSRVVSQEGKILMANFFSSHSNVGCYI